MGLAWLCSAARQPMHSFVDFLSTCSSCLLTTGGSVKNMLSNRSVECIDPQVEKPLHSTYSPKQSTLERCHLIP